MNRRFYYRIFSLLFFSTGLGLFSCSEKNNIPDSEWTNKHIRFESNLKDGVNPRVQGNRWERNDRIGIYMLRTGVKLAQANADELLYANRVYKTESTEAQGSFVPASEEQAMFFPEDGTPVDFISFYPQDAVVQGHQVITDLQVQPMMDLLYSYNLKKVSNQTVPGDLKLVFSHQLNTMRIKLIDKNEKIIRNARIDLLKVASKALFDLSEGSFSDHERYDVTRALKEQGDFHIARLIPGSSLTEARLQIHYQGKTYTFWPENFKSVEAGKRITFTLQLDTENTEKPVEEFGEATIEDWIKGAENDIIVAPDPEEEITPLSQIIALGASLKKDKGQMVIEKDYTIQAVVVNNTEEGQFPFENYYHVVDAEKKAIVITTPKDDKGSILKPGTRITVKVKGLTLTNYYGTLQLQVPASIMRLESGYELQPIVISVDDLLGGNYDLSYVRVENLQFVEPGKPFYSGNSAVYRNLLKNKEGKSVSMETYKTAAFKNENTPKGEGYIIGVVTVSWSSKDNVTYRNLRPSKRSHIVFEGTNPDPSDDYDGEIIKGDPKLMELPKFSGGNHNYFVTHYADGHPNFSFEYDVNLRHPRWVAFTFDSRNSQKHTKRTNAWSWDPEIPAEYSTETWFSGSGYSRGHMVASEDRVYSRQANEQTFYYTNMSPQLQDHNGGIWQRLEARVQAWGRDNNFREVIYVAKGGTIREGQIKEEKIKGIMPVPKYYWMALVVKKNNGEYHGIAFWTEHKAYPNNTSLASLAISIDSLETLTGLDFFHRFPDDIENEVEAQKPENNLSRWPGI
ncbi:Nuclease precursor [Porphyromonas macacae]|uniref:Nuclease n=1 Tax=Porphyromonas macacae TaxID=28115 RepID=A0A379DJ02_9PORP|nr:DNA/RNA non-specific endonuclease [Porphyromonas macacae]SUB78358.1 Nuclease precursor [Porphyromonas macacae]